MCSLQTVTWKKFLSIWGVPQRSGRISPFWFLFFFFFFFVWSSVAPTSCQKISGNFCIFECISFYFYPFSFFFFYPLQVSLWCQLSWDLFIDPHDVFHSLVLRQTARKKIADRMKVFVPDTTEPPIVFWEESNVLYSRWSRNIQQCQ